VGFGVATVRMPGLEGAASAAGVPAIVVGDSVITLAALFAGSGAPDVPSSVRELLLAPGDWWARLADVDAEADRGPEWSRAEDATFLAPLPDPGAIYCAGANYRDHIEEMTGEPPDPGYVIPYHFLAPAGALGGHRDEVRRPQGCAQLDWEVELAAVIGTRASGVDAESALDCVAGYTVANDFSLRDFALRTDVPLGVDWLRSKCYSGCLPMGPAIVPSRFIPDPQQLALTLSVNGTVMQDSSTALMLFSLAEQIVALSHIVPLLPGDIICTGTPAGVGFARNQFLEPGDVTVAEIEHLGRLESRIVGPGDSPTDVRGARGT
jgi:2-keto-4-pentenoate hydratase/2-oxohepta-3-ene-1,7-dioic acid hydratase in catechol pathway